MARRKGLGESEAGLNHFLIESLVRFRPMRAFTLRAVLQSNR